MAGDWLKRAQLMLFFPSFFPTPSVECRWWKWWKSFRSLRFFLFFFTPVVIKLILYMWFLDRIEECFEEAGHVSRERRDLSVLGRWGAKLSFCPRRWAHAEGCSNSSDRLALETKSSVFWSLTGNDCTCKVRHDRREWRMRGQFAS